MSYASLVLFEKGGEAVYLKVLTDSDPNREKLRSERLKRLEKNSAEKVRVVVSSRSPNDPDVWVNRAMRRKLAVAQRKRDKQVARALERVFAKHVV